MTTARVVMYPGVTKHHREKRLLVLLMPLFLIMLHHRAGRDLFRAIAVASAFFGGFFYMLVHALFFIAHTAYGLLLFFWHFVPPSQFVDSPSLRLNPLVGTRFIASPRGRLIHMEDAINRVPTGKQTPHITNTMHLAKT